MGRRALTSCGVVDGVAIADRVWGAFRHVLEAAGRWAPPAGSANAPGAADGPMTRPAGTAES